MTTLSGPMFEPADDGMTRSVFGRHGGHYNIFAARREEDGLAVLRQFFPDGQADQLNFVLFSTSGVHGSYATIEEIEESLGKYGDQDWPDDYSPPTLTYLIVRPRIVSMTYGNATVCLTDIEYLKKLRATSWAAVHKIGSRSEEESTGSAIGTQDASEVACGKMER